MESPAPNPPDGLAMEPFAATHSGIPVTLAEALDVVNDVYVLYDHEFRILYHNEVNRAAMRTVGVDPDTALGRVVTDVLPFLEGTVGMSESRRAMRDRVPTSWEETYHDNLRLRGRAYPAGENLLVVIAQDITAEWHAQRHAAELERRAQEERASAARRTKVLHDLALRLAAASTASGIGHAILDVACEAFGAERGRAVSIEEDGDTAHVIAAFGFTDEQVAGWDRYSIRDRSAPVSHSVATREAQFFESLDDFRARFPDMAPVIERNQSIALALLPVIRDGQVHAVISLGWGQPRTFSPDDRVAMHTMGLQCAEALHRASAFDAEQAARTLAEEANRAKAQFLAAMSHELRTPLNAIGGYAELVTMGVHGPVTDAQRDDLGRIIRNQRHLLGIINDILNFAKLEAAALEFDSSPQPVAKLLAGLEPMIAPQLRERSLSYSVSGECAATLSVLGDGERIGQALINLLSNAVKFTEPGGRIWITCEHAGGVVSISVHDTGIGIPADKINSVFDPFVQAHRSLTEVTAGTGLGLAISRDLARRMGGDVTVQSSVGNGSVFTLTLPAA